MAPFSDLPDAAPVASLHGADDVERLAATLYGNAPRATGVVHVVSAWLRRPDRLSVLRVDADAPACAHDQFALGLARARADAILTTGEILRREPELRHALDAVGDPSGRLGHALAAWRREVLAKTSPPVSLVLTSGRDLDLDHPIFRGPSRTVVFTDRAGAWRLESAAMNRGVEVVADAAPSARSAVAFLRAAFGAATVLVEAGPTSSRPLYDDPPVIDELLLSIDHAESLDARWRGPSFPGLDALNGYFSEHTRPHRVAGSDGPWDLLRFVRRPC